LWFASPRSKKARHEITYLKIEISWRDIHRQISPNPCLQGMNPYNFSVLCFGFCALLIGLFVWLKREDKVGYLYFILALFYAGWALPFSIKISDNISYDGALLAARIANCSAAFIPTVWFHFCLTYSGRSQTHLKLLRLLYCVPFFILTIFYTPWFVTGVRPILGFKYYATPGIFYHLMTLNYFVVVPFGFLQLVKKINEAPKNEKSQIWGLFWAALIGYVGGSLTFFPIYGIPLPQYGMFLTPIYPFAVAYFLVRRGLFNVEELAQAAHRDKLTAIGALAASINHEIKNPLLIIKGLAESCLDRQKEGIFQSEKKALESANDAMKRSMDQADRAMDIIKRLSMFAKAGIEGEMKFEAVSIAAVLEDILPLVRYELAANNIALTREIPKDLPDVQADRRYLEEIFFNLIVNACQAIKEGGKPDGEIRIVAQATLSRPGLEKHLKTGSLEGDQHRVLVTVADNGPGIPADKLAHVFRPFYTTKAEGTGLGLYITQQLVEKIRGRISVESESGKGTTFTLLFPQR
jgi:signal transduction histidine kinase